MQCERVQALLYRWIDARLLSDDAERVREHLGACPTCTQRLARIRDVDETFAGIEDEKPSARLRARILDAYRRKFALRSNRAPIGRRLARGLRYAAVLALVAAGSSAATFLAVKPGERSQPIATVTTHMPTSIDQIFPLVLADSYTMHYPDGRMKYGSNVHIVR